MKNRINLRIRIYLILTFLVLITLGSSLVMVWYTYQMEGLLTSIIENNLTAYQVAESLETALVNQKGFVSYYFMDGNPNWLRQLEIYRQIFNEQIKKAESLAETEYQKNALKKLEAEYNLYRSGKDSVIEHYRSGDLEKGKELHENVRSHFFKTLDLCEEYEKEHSNRIRVAANKSHLQAYRLRIIAGTSMLFVFFLTALLAFVLLKHILGPVRRLALEADRERDSPMSEDEIKSLSRSVRGLLEDMDHTHIELEKSREHLMQSEKMAMVGKLAAGMAHSIRNPLTSVKMRLFSLGRTLDLSETEEDDLKVISEEIRHIDTIVQNFLEFSRPPRLKMQPVSPSDVVDLTIQLLRHRLESCDVRIKLCRNKPLPAIQADPEQLKEVFVNLIVNACESMEGSGLIEIYEKEILIKASYCAQIEFKDQGTGIPESIRDEIFQPFFTTKEEGTGLGLSIAARIIEEHGGRLEYKNNESKGSAFIVTIPTGESVKIAKWPKQGQASHKR